MGKKLNDTIALQATPFGGNECNYMTKEIRKIDNGYITRESHDSGLGYKSVEKYTPNHPHSDGAVLGSGNAMAKAVDFMNKK